MYFSDLQTRRSKSKTKRKLEFTGHATDLDRHGTQCTVVATSYTHSFKKCLVVSKTDPINHHQGGNLLPRSCCLGGEWRSDNGTYYVPSNVIHVQQSKRYCRPLQMDSCARVSMIMESDMPIHVACVFLMVLCLVLVSFCVVCFVAHDQTYVRTDGYLSLFSF